MKRCLMSTFVANVLLQGVMNGTIDKDQFPNCEVIIEDGKVQEYWSTDGYEFVSYHAVNKACADLPIAIQLSAIEIIEEAA